MRFSVSLVLAGIFLGAVALPATAAPAAHAKAKAETGVWEVSQGEFAGRQTCMALGLADQSTILMLKLDTGHMANHVIAIILGNTGWSIKEGDELGELELHAGDTTAGAEPVAIDHALIFYMSLEPAQVLFDKPLNLGHWIKAIEKDYFAGPPDDSPTAARAHEMRNSHPASARFKISVNASGEMTNCTVIGTNGLPDWAFSFCAIAMRHDLKFAPAQTASGKAVAGDYVSTARAVRKLR